MHWFNSWQGESFYNPHIAKVIEELNSKGLVEESEGARVIFLEGFDIPLMVVKSDGGFNYASTDLTALWWVIFTLVISWNPDFSSDLLKIDLTCYDFPCLYLLKFDLNLHIVQWIVCWC